MTEWEKTEGKWYWVYECIDRENIEMPVSVQSADENPKSSYSDIKTVYRPVMVEENSKGERRAFYYDADADPIEVLDDGGREYVPMQQVHRSPPTNAEPAYKYE